MTLVEVLAALVLMGMVAGATLPLLRSSVRALRAPEPAASAFTLEGIADSLVADPEALGLESLPTSGVVVLAGGGPASAALGRVQVELLRAQDPDVEHAWLAVSGGGRTVYRWLADPPRGDGQ